MKNTVSTAMIRLASLTLSIFFSHCRVAVVHAQATTASGVSLTPENYEQRTAGKIVFIKFYAPWCGHCQEMAPAWEKLTKQYTDSTDYLVAEVDCSTPETEKWCGEEFEIKGFPTLLFGDPGRKGILLEEYQGERDFETLAEFAQEFFAKALCNMDHLEGCSADTKVKLQQFLRMSDAEVETEINRIEEEIEAIEVNLAEALDELQADYDHFATAFEISKANIRKEIGWLLEIKEIRTAPSQSIE